MQIHNNMVKVKISFFTLMMLIIDTILHTWDPMQQSQLATQEQDESTIGLLPTAQFVTK